MSSIYLNFCQNFEIQFYQFSPLYESQQKLYQYILVSVKILRYNFLRSVLYMEVDRNYTINSIS